MVKYNYPKLKNNSPARTRAIFFVAVFTIIGTGLILKSFASSPIVSLEIENGTVSRAVSVNTDVKASGGKYIQFGNNSTVITPPPTSGLSYYVDCNASDTNNGMSASTAWKTLARANQLSLQPGQNLLLKRGCIWNEQLVAKWNGTSNSPIFIGAYGTGNDPVIERDAASKVVNLSDVAISGSYMTIDHISTSIRNPYRNSLCLQQDGTAVPDGFYAGFSLNGNNNILQYLDGQNLSVGITMGDSASYNKILYNHFHDMNYLWRIDKASGALGSIGINLHGNDNEVANNLFERNGAACVYTDDGTKQQYGAPIEVYNANRNYVHHNTAYGHRKHFEMGHDSAHTTDDNIVAFNLFVSDYPGAVGINIHGAGNPFGPINRTQVYNNTIVLTGANSQGVVCSCSGGATLKNNIIVAEGKAAYFNGTMSETNNIYWDYGNTTDSTSDPQVQFNSATQSTISASSRQTNPNFINVTNDFKLQSSSYGVNKGQIIVSSDTKLINILKSDLIGTLVPQNGNPDIGAYEQ